MCATILTGRDVVDVEDTTYFERNLHILIDIREASPRILLLGQIDDLAVVYSSHVVKRLSLEWVIVSANALD
jgi:hypothetical protein